MAMAKSHGTACGPTNENCPEGECFVVPPAENTDEVETTLCVNPSPNQQLSNEPYVKGALDSNNAVTEDSAKAATAATMALISGSTIKVTFYHHRNNDAAGRSFTTDWSIQRHNVHYDFQKIHNFQMKLKGDFTFSYEPAKVKSQLTGEAVIYPYFVPYQGDLFIYQVTPARWGLYKITSAPTRMSIRETTVHEIQFILIEYLDKNTLAKLDACVSDEAYFDLDRYINGEGALLSSDEATTLQEIKSAYEKLIRYYVDEFFEKYIYRTFIENCQLYDPYLVEFLVRILTRAEMGGYPLQLISDPTHWKRSFWFHLLDPKSMPVDYTVDRCFRMVRNLHYRNTKANALSNRCYIKLDKCGKHPYPPFKIPEDYDRKLLTIQMQVRLYLDDGKVRPKVLLELVDQLIKSCRLAQFYFIPIAIFLLKKAYNALIKGEGDIIANEDSNETCNGLCDECVYACSCSKYHSQVPECDPCTTGHDHNGCNTTNKPHLAEVSAFPVPHQVPTSEYNDGYFITDDLDDGHTTGSITGDMLD